MKESDKTLFFLNHETLECIEGTTYDLFFKNNDYLYHISRWYDVSWAAYYRFLSGVNGGYSHYKIINKSDTLSTKNQAIDWCIDHWVKNKND